MIIIHPKNKLIKFLQETFFIFPKVTRSQPIAKALTYFSDGSSNGIQGPNITKIIQTSYTSAQKAELVAIQQVLKIILYPCNIVSDSQYVIQLVQKLETAKLKELNDELFQLVFFFACNKLLDREHHHFLLLIYILILLYEVLYMMVIKRWTSLSLLFLKLLMLHMHFSINPQQCCVDSLVCLVLLSKILLNPVHHMKA